MEQKDEQRSEYDVFLSYRWGPSDSTFVQSVFDRFGLFTTGEGGREVQVFLDRECLQEGRLFQNEFASSLKNTLVVVPVVSSDALRRMCSGSPLVEDNVLVEVIRYCLNPSVHVAYVVCAVGYVARVLLLRQI